jgi:uncharacterized protein YbjT (DUF2867 family)
MTDHTATAQVTAAGSGPILITGATGTTGRHLAQILRERGAHVRAATRIPRPDADADADADVFFDWDDPATYPAAPEWAILQPSWFMQNFTGTHPTAIALRERGEIATATGNGRVGFIDARDIAAAAAETLLTPEPPNARYVLTGPETLSYPQIAAILTEVTGRHIRHTALTAEHSPPAGPPPGSPRTSPQPPPTSTSRSATATTTTPPPPPRTSPAGRRGTSRTSPVHTATPGQTRPPRLTPGSGQSTTTHRDHADSQDCSLSRPATPH